MCGIAGGFALQDGARVDRERLCRMAGLMGHRGPDGEGFWGDPWDRAALDAFLTLGYVPAPHSIWEGIRKLPAGTMLRMSSSGPVSRRYWGLEETLTPFEGSFTGAVDRLEELLTTSVTLRLRSDVPLGLFLSGGIDSSLVAAIAARECRGDALTFSLGFAEAAFDESPHAERIAKHLGTRHRTFTGRPAMLEVLPTLVRHFGEPFGDSSALAAWLLAR